MRDKNYFGLENYLMNISILVELIESLTVMVYVPVSVPVGIVQGVENVPSPVTGVSNDARFPPF